MGRVGEDSGEQIGRIANRMLDGAWIANKQLLSYEQKKAMVMPYLRNEYPDATDINYDFDTGNFYIHFPDKSITKIPAYELIEKAFPRDSGEAGQYIPTEQELHIRRAGNPTVTAVLFIPHFVADNITIDELNELRIHTLTAYRTKLQEIKDRKLNEAQMR